MLKRFCTIATLAMASGLLGAVPARAQSPLGFSIDPTLGLPGITVTGQVDVDDVAQFCVTDLAEFQAEFQALIDGPYAGGGPEGELFSRFFPGGEFVFENCDQAAYSLTGLVALGIGANIGGAAETAFPQSFVMTFADIATQNPIGQLGRFDPTTGVGSVVVPDIPPGVAAIAATCVSPQFDVDLLEAGIRENGAFLEAIGASPCDINSPEFSQFVADFLGQEPDIFAFLNAIGPSLLQNVVKFDALGLQLFTVQSIEELIGGLADTINGLVAAGDLKPGHGKGFLNRLRAVSRSLDKTPPRKAAACRQLANLIDKVQMRIDRGQLSADGGGGLIDQIEAFMTSLQCSA
jgi:hypothetical protein